VTSGDVQPEERAGSTRKRFCLFSIAGEVVGVPVTALFEVVSGALITPLPKVPLGLVGLMNFRGEILPVVDLGPWIGIPVIPRLQVMVLGTGGHQVGVAVDAIRDMVETEMEPEGTEGVDELPLGGALQRVTVDRFGDMTAAEAAWIVDASPLLEGLTQTFSSVAEVV